MLWYSSNWVVAEESNEQLLAEKSGKQQVFAKKLFPFPHIMPKMEGLEPQRAPYNSLMLQLLLSNAQLYWTLI